jgi:AcrR family transcriptional regulator
LHGHPQEFRRQLRAVAGRSSLRSIRPETGVRRHGWSGNTPASDEEAIDRILDAVDLLVESGKAVRVTEVARILGVSRPTVYRYFPGTEALMAGSSVRSADGFMERFAEHVRGLKDPAAALVEGVAFAVESLVGDRQINQVLTARVNGSPVVPFASELASAFGRSMLGRYDVDWARHGYDDAALDEVGELCMRTFHSLLVDPGELVGDGMRLRRFITGWLAPAIHYRQTTRTVEALESFAAAKPARRTGNSA